MKWNELDNVQTNTGIKDRHLLHFLEELQKLARVGEEHNLTPAEIMATLVNLRDTWPPDEDLFNPAFAIPGTHLSLSSLFVECSRFMPSRF